MEKKHQQEKRDRQEQNQGEKEGRMVTAWGESAFWACLFGLSWNKKCTVQVTQSYRPKATTESEVTARTSHPTPTQDSGVAMSCLCLQTGLSGCSSHDRGVGMLKVKTKEDLIPLPAKKKTQNNPNPNEGQNKRARQVKGGEKGVRRM